MEVVPIYYIAEEAHSSFFFHIWLKQLIHKQFALIQLFQQEGFAEAGLGNTQDSLSLP